MDDVEWRKCMRCGDWFRTEIKTRGYCDGCRQDLLDEATLMTESEEEE